MDSSTTSAGGSAAERPAAAAAAIGELAGDVSVHQQRPLPPSAIRKRSAAYHASGASSSAPSPRLDDAFEEDISREDLERALEGLSRDDLVIALGRAKKALDSLDAQLDARTGEFHELQAFTEDLIAKSNLSAADQQAIKDAVAQRDERNDHLLREQERLEEELYAQIQVVERLRRQLQESERSQAEIERRYTDQTATADKERQAFSDMEALLRSQKASESAANEKLGAENLALQRENERMANHIAALQASTGSTLALDDEVKGDDGLTPGARRARAKSAADAEAVALRSELAATQKAQGSYVEAVQQLQTELSELKSENASLRDTNYSLIDILQEKSFSGALFAESAVLSRGFQGKGGRAAAAASMLAETESDTDDGSDDTASNGTGDVEDDVPDRPESPVKPRRRKGKQNPARSRSNSNALLEVPTDLGSELAQSGAFGQGKDKGKGKGTKRDRSGHEVSSDPEVLQKELIELRETNSALTVYISKVIDRVLARDGFERVLSTDPETKRAGIGSQRSKARSRPSILPVNTESGNKNSPPTSAGGTPEIGATASANKRQSMGILGFGRSPLALSSSLVTSLSSSSVPENGIATNGSSTASSSNKPASAAAAHGRSRMSVDWRGLLSGMGGGSGAPAKDPREANLRPLVLRTASISTASGAARKVSESEEIEDQVDRIERERIRADLQMQGYSPPDNQLRQRTTSTTGNSASGSGGGSSITAFLSRVVSGSSTGSGGNSTNTSTGTTNSPRGGAGSGRDLLAEPRARTSAAGTPVSEEGEPLGKLRFPSTDSGPPGTRTSSMAGDESYLVRGP
ncbi:unnamed protein product [Tilletia controversa]|uniref:Uncharacterized protein n=3 Tax=Tilletia TaxID=13289 RepID=A0A8X7MSC8_9BASI|nr:hypothetical protein CF336_g4705 [Tilletia laevis]KAE8195039.1 hypothetical protein CF328_g4563 [Tilletia controversa]KAE8256678.1 hypothetical protein A4X03_0g5167 [Tilletia caries]KAE8199469.1 hypothetical protein CF335_g4166 [Tilletia laevis]KAE8246227.1 hypothetical protein A4X06_0g5099 [Tilletia controversa]